MGSTTAVDGLPGRRRRLVIGLALAALLMLPPAIALACNPQAHINLSQSSYSPGSTITVYGSYFPGGKPITVITPSGSTTVTPDAGGTFVMTLSAPHAAGDYLVTALKPGVAGSSTGGSAPASFAVVAPVVTPAPSAPASTPASTPSSTPASTPSPAFNVPIVHASPAGKFQSTSVAATAKPSTTSSPVVAVTPVATVQTQSGQTVFAGSVPVTPIAPAPVVVPTTHRAAATAPAPAIVPSASQLSATSDLWSGFSAGQGASLTSGAQGMMNGSGTSSALTIGIGLLAFGLIALVSGLAVAEVRRRRTV